jgi:hypothetical protein
MKTLIKDRTLKRSEVTKAHRLISVFDIRKPSISRYEVEAVKVKIE